MNEEIMNLSLRLKSRSCKACDKLYTMVASYSPEKVCIKHTGFLYSSVQLRTMLREYKNVSSLPGVEPGIF